MGYTVSHSHSRHFKGNGKRLRPVVQTGQYVRVEIDHS
ncbi:hypothetical protein Agau_C100486 [Agrobacterium tumefaciens F2]|nr:hypothetical protein Agau_C100486 [Agrobacterium tumefaciens F2]